MEYTGHPGVYTDGGGEAEGWFRSDNPAGDGSFVTTEPVGTEAWMPLNNHPSVKPTYDFNEKVTKGRTVIANGELVKPEGGVSAEDNPPDATVPGRLDDLALALARADRQLPGREQHRRL